MLGDLGCRARRQTSHEWRRAVQEGMPQAAQVSLRADEAAVPELLNLAWARHEIDSDAAAQVRSSVRYSQAAKELPRSVLLHVDLL